MDIFGTSGENMAELFDMGVNAAAVLPGNDLASLKALYITSSVLTFERSPYVSNPNQTSLRILGVLGGMSVYGDEEPGQRVFRHTKMPDGTIVQVKEASSGLRTAPLSTALPDDLSPGLPTTAVDAMFEVSAFMRNLGGLFESLKIDLIPHRLTSNHPIKATVSGLYYRLEMYDDYLAGLKQGKITKSICTPSSPNLSRRHDHKVLTREGGQMISFTMYDKRPDHHAIAS